MSKKPPSLSAEKIATLCAAFVPSLIIETVAQTGSTNSDLIGRVSSLFHPTLLVADLQIAGRGRAGRRWLSENNSSLTFSLAWPFSTPHPSLLGLPLAVGTALAQALAEMDVTVQLKWPNDVLRDGKKLAGILIETVHTAKQTWVIIGIGLNLTMSDALEQHIGQSVADVRWLAQMDKHPLLATLLRHVVSCLQQFATSGFANFVLTWNKWHAYQGQQVSIVDQEKILQQGTVLGVDQSGCLLLQDKNSTIWPIMTGDVSLRLV